MHVAVKKVLVKKMKKVLVKSMFQYCHYPIFIG